MDKVSEKRNDVEGVRLVAAAFILIAALALMSCDDETEQYIPAPCELNNTAVVSFKNGFADKTFHVFLDGERMATLAPGEVSEYFTVSAGTKHTVESRDAADDLPLCTKAEFNFALCSAGTIACPGGE